MGQTKITSTSHKRLLKIKEYLYEEYEYILMCQTEEKIPISSNVHVIMKYDIIIINEQKEKRMNQSMHLLEETIQNEWY